MTESGRGQIIELIKKEVIPAIGYAEPITTALCVAKAAEMLGVEPEKIGVLLSVNMLENAIGVGAPGTDMVGPPIAVALGASIGKSDYQSEVLRDCMPEAMEQGKRFIAEKRICISLKEDTTEKPHTEMICKVGDKTIKVIIVGGHTTFIYITKDEQTLFGKQHTVSEEEEDAPLESNLRRAYGFALTTPLDEVRFILDTARLNKAATEQALKGSYGYFLGKMPRGTYGHKVIGDNVFSHILSYTPAACDAQMTGATILVTGNSGSDNQGISVTLLAVVFAEKNGENEEGLIHALVLSHPTVIYIKQGLGRLSALCGCMVAATGSSCGIIWLMGGSYNQAAFTVQNMIANLTGIVCDGAKPNCALKVTTETSTAALLAMMATEGRCVTPVEGIIDEDVDQSIRNLTRVGS